MKKGVILGIVVLLTFISVSFVIGDHDEPNIIKIKISPGQDPFLYANNTARPHDTLIGLPDKPRMGLTEIR